MSDKKKGFGRSLFSTGGLVLIMIILVLVNVIFFRFNLRWDVTKDKLYSLSDGTKNIISNLKEDVIIKVFYSKSNVSIPVNIKTFARRMLDFLSEYENYSKGNVSIEIYDPVADSEEEEWAQKYGIKGIDLPTGDRIYFGLVAMAGDQEETISMMDPSREEHLEYDITRVVSKVQSPQKLKIGIISSLPVFGGRTMRSPRSMSPWLFISELKKNYDVKEINLSSGNIDMDTDLLILMHPKGISENLLYAVDQYVLRGNSIIVFTDPFSLMDGSQGQARDSSLEKLLASWGVTMDSTKVVIDFGNSTRLRTPDNRLEDNPLWISLRTGSFSSKDIITSKLDTMLLPVAGAIKKIPGSAFEYEALLQSSTNSALTDSYKARLGVMELRRDFTPTNEKYDFAVRISGVFKTAFPGDKPDKDQKNSSDTPGNSSDKNAGKKEKSLKEGKEKSTIIIVADTDMLFDGYYVDMQNFMGFNISHIFNDNLNFLLNTSEMLSGNEDLISIRSRGKFGRPFTRVLALEKKAQAKWLNQEQELARKAEETNRKLRELEHQKDTSQEFILSEKQEAEIKKFQQEKQVINKELKKVRRRLRADIESLGNFIKFVNIFLMPLIVSLAGIAYGLYKRKKSLLV